MLVWVLQLDRCKSCSTHSSVVVFLFIKNKEQCLENYSNGRRAYLLPKASTKHRLQRLKTKYRTLQVLPRVPPRLLQAIGSVSSKPWSRTCPLPARSWPARKAVIPCLSLTPTPSSLPR